MKRSEVAKAVRRTFQRALDGAVFFPYRRAKPHQDEVGEDLLSDGAAWLTAMRLSRDIESNLQPGQEWPLDVREDDIAVYSVEIKTLSHRAAGNHQNVCARRSKSRQPDPEPVKQ